MTVDAATRRQVIDGVLARLTEAYVFPDTAVAMERAIRDRVRRGEYERITSAQALADSLTAHLQTVTQDRHLRVRYSDEPLPRLDAQPGPTPEMEARARAFGRQVNFGFERVERLPGNVGYLEVRSFGFEPAWIEDVAAAAFTFLANTDALIIDVRRNGGGTPGMVAFVSSYLFGADSVHLNSLYWRPGNRTEHFYTRTRVPGVRYGPDRPVYVLTSRRTFSGAEEFAYNLQTRQRAVIVGDTTGGGAHPGGMQRVTDHFGVWVLFKTRGEVLGQAGGLGGHLGDDGHAGRNRRAHGGGDHRWGLQLRGTQRGFDLGGPFVDAPLAAASA